MIPWMQSKLHVFFIGISFCEYVANPGGRCQCRFLYIFLYEFIQLLSVLALPHEVVVLDGKALHLVHLLLPVGVHVFKVGLVQLLQHIHPQDTSILLLLTNYVPKPYRSSDFDVSFRIYDYLESSILFIKRFVSIRKHHV